MSDDHEDGGEDMDEMKVDANNTTNTASFDKHEFEQHIKECRDKLSQHPNNYDCHLNLVRCLSSIANIAPFRRARDKMYCKFAIPPSVQIPLVDLEIEYLQLTNSLAVNQQNEQIQNILQLYQNAVFDYAVDFDLWSRYLRFAFAQQSVIGIDYIRDKIVSPAVLTIGQHFHEGHKFWSLYREFETQHLAFLLRRHQNNDDDNNDGDATPEMQDMDGMDSDHEDERDPDEPTEKIQQQTQRIRRLWRQQIAIPHYQLEETYQRYQDWECQLYGEASSDYKQKYAACKKLSKYFKSWEERLSSLAPNASAGYASAERLQFWQAYIGAIRQQIKHIKPKTVLMLFERAVLDCFLHEQVWVDYVEFIKESGLKFEILNVNARGVRNVAQSVRLWMEYIHGCQWTEQPMDEVNRRIFARFKWPKEKAATESLALHALQQHYHVKHEEMIDFGTDMDKYITLLIHRCEFYRRRAQCVLDEEYSSLSSSSIDNAALVKEAQAVFEDTALFMQHHMLNQWALTFVTFYTDFLSRFVGEISRARDVWEMFIKHRGKEWNVWLAFIEWEGSFGELDPVPPSSRKRRAVGDDENETEDVTEQPKQPQKLHKRFGQRNTYRIRHLYHRAMFLLDADTGVGYIAERLLQFERMCGDLQSLTQANLRYQRKLAECEKRRQKNEAKRMQKHKRKRHSNDQNVANEQQQQHAVAIDNKAMATAEQLQEQQPPQTTTCPPPIAAAAAVDNKDERTVFVYNFRKTMQRPDLQDVFAQFGDVEALRLPMDKNAKHRSQLRGLAYVTYKRKPDAERCIAELNGKSIQGKVLNVQHYRSKNDYSKTVHIRGLSGFDQSEAERCVHEILKECGEIREIRLTKDQKTDGYRLKGFGYVEFVENASVAKALKCDKTVYGDKIIEVLPYKMEEKRDKKMNVHPRKHDRDHEKAQMQQQKSEATQQTMDVDDHRNSKELTAISSEFGSKLGFVPRSMRRKSMLKETDHSNDGHDYNAQILNKGNKTQNDFRKLFNL